MNEALRDLLRREVVCAPDGEEFTLASGQTSSWYIDCRPVTFGEPEIVAHAVMGKLSVESTRQGEPEGEWEIPFNFDAIGGPAIGAIPIATGLVACYGSKSFTVRRQPKDHGKTDSLIVGALDVGDRVVLVDDVWTTGGSLLEAFAEIIRFGAVVVAVCVLVCRDPVVARSGDRFIEVPKVIENRHDDQQDLVPLFWLFEPDDLGVGLET